MKATKLLLIPTLLLAATATTLAQLNIPSDGSDGDFAPTGDVVVDLGQATQGNWNDNNAANSGRGVYDASKWAVVFKFRSVNIPGYHDTNGVLVGAHVTFINNKSRAPVVWLVQSNVNIGGILDLGGGTNRAAVDALLPTEPGPGGFRGGPAGPLGWGTGLGPGGNYAGVGNWISPAAYASFYGNPAILPLIGGSGSGANGYSGGGGGGAILIASASTVRVDGAVIASGGGLSAVTPNQPRGSGGAVKIIANALTGSGFLQALPDGRIRIETPLPALTVHSAPEAPSVPPATPPTIWPPDNAPAVRVVSVDGIGAPVDPAAALYGSVDVPIQNNGAVRVVLEATNFPLEGSVQVRYAQKWGAATWISATNSAGTFAQSTWIANITFAQGYGTLQARATVP